MSIMAKKKSGGKVLFIISVLIFAGWFGFTYYQNNIQDNCSTITYRRTLPMQIKKINTVLRRLWFCMIIEICLIMGHAQKNNKKSLN